MHYPDQKEFLRLCRKGNLIPVYREIPGDMDTPVSTYLKLRSGAKYSFLLESVEGEEKLARYSFMATAPKMVIRSQGRELHVTTLDQGRIKKERLPIKRTPLEYIRQVMRRYRLVDIPGLPRFCGGMVGYIGYDVVRFFERLPDKPKDDLKLPDILLVLAKDLVIFDHRNHKIKVVRCVHVDPKASADRKIAAYREAVKQIDKTVAKIAKPLKMMGDKIPVGSKIPSVGSNMTQRQYEDIVQKAKKYIRAGDIIQVVLSQRFCVDLKTGPFEVYRRLRLLNPSPYMYFLNFDDIQIAGSSPELLVRCEDGIVETRPIAGTRRRGKSDAEDQALAKELLADPKERAEHIMLVDLGRNDLGRVCSQGTVKVSEFMAVEKYSHVMHIVSNVKGRLKPSQDAFDVLEAAFPAGTLSGAPKIRAMEIIDELENVSRGPYGGCIGYFSFNGNLDSCITIRTIVIKGKKAYIQAGAGIVADSVPLNEYRETVNKARAQVMAIESAHR
ncbi:MAG: anthranilate synthase component I [Candidatus Omnitrophota bacterium]|nr:anthranilate synthase component I [Candidatus Omnitrophota bacterium]MDZ4243289.1 anthranilate synthase component I [Candidatus Omnitrophota bacterium]